MYWSARCTFDVEGVVQLNCDQFAFSGCCNGCEQDRRQYEQSFQEMQSILHAHFRGRSSDERSDGRQCDMFARESAIADAADGLADKEWIRQAVEKEWLKYQ